MNSVGLNCKTVDPEFVRNALERILGFLSSRLPRWNDSVRCDGLATKTLDGRRFYVNGGRAAWRIGGSFRYPENRFRFPREDCSGSDRLRLFLRVCREKNSGNQTPSWRPLRGRLVRGGVGWETRVLLWRMLLRQALFASLGGSSAWSLQASLSNLSSRIKSRNIDRFDLR